LLLSPHEFQFDNGVSFSIFISSFSICGGGGGGGDGGL
jgi:hypothetical protein